MTPPEGGATGGGWSASVIEGEWLDGADDTLDLRLAEEEGAALAGV